MTHPIKALSEKALAEFKHDPHAHYVEELATEVLRLLEEVERLRNKYER